MLTAPGHPFDFDGKDYFVGRITQGDKETFHAYANANAIRIVQDMAKAQTEEEAAATYAEVLKRVTTGYYWWDEEGGLAYRRTWAGFLRLFWITLKVKTDKGKFIQPPYETVQAMAEVDGGKWLVQQSVAANANPTDPQRSESLDGELYAELAQRWGITEQRRRRMTDAQIMELFGTLYTELDDEAPNDGPDLQDWLVTHYMETEGMTAEEARQEIIDQELRMRCPTDAG